jgi:hypothetical protein
MVAKPARVFDRHREWRALDAEVAAGAVHDPSRREQIQVDIIVFGQQDP